MSNNNNNSPRPFSLHRTISSQSISKLKSPASLRGFKSPGLSPSLRYRNSPVLNGSPRDRRRDSIAVSVSSPKGTSTFAVVKEDDVDTVYVVGGGGSTPSSVKLTPLVNRASWYHSPYGHATMDTAEVEVGMDELMLDLMGVSAAAAAVAAEEEEVVAPKSAPVVVERLTFAQLSVDSGVKDIYESDEEDQKNSKVSSSLSKWKKGFKLPWLQSHGKVAAVSASEAVSGPAPTYLSLLEAEGTSSRDKKKRYLNVKTLGKGIQGEVSLRVHVGTGSRVAVKTIFAYPNTRATFQREVEILKKVHGHPNVIQLLDYWEGKSNVYQTFELCSGGDLEGLRVPLNEMQALALFAPLADAVKYLHNMGIIHRDIRPANIFLRRAITGTESIDDLISIPVLADFGISTVESLSGRLGTQFFERPPHIAPEVVDGGRFEKTADVFGLGVCLVPLFLGRPITLEDQDARLKPLEDAWNRLSVAGRLLYRQLLEVDPSKRITAAQVLELPLFDFYVKRA
ncbi:hypothetical protein HDU79_008654 [Rhizoclosmatium sp. JEL0117]|nr:hypothetical protein HDU79_008654 [Rhizoclosmatium sp. JEL0117]